MSLSSELQDSQLAFLQQPERGEGRSIRGGARHILRQLLTKTDSIECGTRPVVKDAFRIIFDKLRSRHLQFDRHRDDTAASPRRHRLHNADQPRELLRVVA